MAVVALFAGELDKILPEAVVYWQKK